MTRAEAIAHIKDWPGPASTTTRDGRSTPTSWPSPCRSGRPPSRSSGLAERYLDETRGVDLSRLPDDIHHALRFHPACVFGPGAVRPCLIALMRDPLTDMRRRHPAHRASRSAAARSGRSSGACWARPASSSCGRPAKRLSSAKGSRPSLAAATRIPYRGKPLIPAWAALSAVGLRALPIIPGVRRLDPARRQ